MSIEPQALPTLSPSQRYLAGILLRLRRLVNRCVASMLANRERAAMQFAKGPMPQRHGRRCHAAKLGSPSHDLPSQQHFNPRQ